jgi:hypothetical protein
MDLAYRALNLHYYVFHGIDFPLVQLGVWSFIACMFASGGFRNQQWRIASDI